MSAAAVMQEHNQPIMPTTAVVVQLQMLLLLLLLLLLPIKQPLTSLSCSSWLMSSKRWISSRRMDLVWRGVTGDQQSQVKAGEGW
jgi:hypothetical protein